MFDGKVTYAITKVPSHATCDVCKTKPSLLNTISSWVNKPVDELALSLGISPLHSRIRCLEYFFNLAVRLPLKVSLTTHTHTHTHTHTTHTHTHTHTQTRKELRRM
eukprot:Pompholyxophrys_punicea_v1_NODE_161_length_3061_cov_8.793413.p2 type:complete len:106 gc:universal NODE_161_length_3061_cov_8.793413:1627-1944(+)